MCSLWICLCFYHPTINCGLSALFLPNIPTILMHTPHMPKHIMPHNINPRVLHGLQVCLAQMFPMPGGHSLSFHLPSFLAMLIHSSLKTQLLCPCKAPRRCGKRPFSFLMFIVLLGLHHMLLSQQSLPWVYSHIPSTG